MMLTTCRVFLLTNHGHFRNPWGSGKTDLVTKENFNQVQPTKEIMFLFPPPWDSPNRTLNRVILYKFIHFPTHLEACTCDIQLKSSTSNWAKISGPTFAAFWPRFHRHPFGHQKASCRCRTHGSLLCKNGGTILWMYRIPMNPLWSLDRGKKSHSYKVDRFFLNPALWIH